MGPYKLTFFSNLVEKNLLTVKKISKCRENDKDRWRNGKSDWPTTWILPSYRGQLGSTLASFLEDGNVKTSDSWHPQCFLCEKHHRGLNTSSWTEVSLLPWRLQKITRAASQVVKMNPYVKIFFCPGIWKMSSKNAQELLGPSQSNVRCYVSETKSWSKQEVNRRCH